MEWVETIGKTLDEAKEAALEQLGVDASDAEFVVLVEPRAGLFGRLRGEARVRARVRPTQPRAKRGRDRHRGAADSRRTARGAGRDSPPPARADAVTVPQRPRRSTGPSKTPKPAADDARRPERDERSGPGSTEAALVVDHASPSRARRRGRGRAASPARPEPGEVPRASEIDQVPAPAAVATDQGRGAPVVVASPSGASRTAASHAGASADGLDQTAKRRSAGGMSREDQEREEPVGDLTVQDQGRAAQGFVRDLVSRLGLHASVELLAGDDETVTVAVEGDELGILVGPGGSTLAALQELTRTYVQKITGGQSGRVMVDVAGYRAKRVQALQRFTRGVAEEVLTSGEPRALEAMAAADRKVVHDTVNEIDGVETRSEGEDDRRYVVILPTEQRGAG